MPFIFYPVVMMALAELPIRPLLSRLAIVLPFCVLAGLSNIFFDTDSAFEAAGLDVSYGFISFISIIIKAILSASAVMILAATTPASELSSQLIRFKIPSMIVMQLTMTYRYIGVLLEEASTMYTAYILRTPGQKGIRIKDMGVFVGQLVIRSIDRAQRIYIAMKCRGYNGVAGYAEKKKIGNTDLLYLLISLLLILALRLVNISTLIGSLLV
jgi:cobalt/nickel transport system permease protein